MYQDTSLVIEHDMIVERKVGYDDTRTYKEETNNTK